MVTFTTIRCLAIASFFFINATAANYGKTITVKSGKSIQNALDKANSGDRVVVEKGTYSECLTISKSSITLEGRNAVLKPGKCKKNTCTGLVGADTVAGICITGSVKLTDEVVNNEHRHVVSVSKYVEKVIVKGFSVQGFDGLNIAILGGKGVEVYNNKVSNGTHYGILTVGSKGTRIRQNKVTSSDVTKRFIGICMDDQSNVAVSQNDISDYQIGLCVQTNEAEVDHNRVTKCCIGAFVDPLIKKANVHHNKISTSNPKCKDSPFGSFVFGILVNGAIESKISYNTITGISDYGSPDPFASGIGVSDDMQGTGSKAVGNRIDHNIFKNNDFDIGAEFATGPNTFDGNQCTKGSPAALNICSQ